MVSTEKVEKVVKLPNRPAANGTQLSGMLPSVLAAINRPKKKLQQIDCNGSNREQ